ncbi:hypothetical protein HK104_011311 [Borealophlyctis nickersoniae]|nr:hypothetical protein HK104_011311 [Borealophlyctis nickersoniae]
MGLSTLAVVLIAVGGGIVALVGLVFLYKLVKRSTKQPNFSDPERAQGGPQPPMRGPTTGASLEGLLHPPPSLTRSSTPGSVVDAESAGTVRGAGRGGEGSGGGGLARANSKGPGMIERAKTSMSLARKPINKGSIGSGGKGGNPEIKISKRVQSIDPPPQSPGDVLMPQLSGTKLALFTFKRRRGDEVTIRIGDPMSIYRYFDDGWVFGMNWRTGLSGMFPLVAVIEERDISRWFASLPRPQQKPAASSPPSTELVNPGSFKSLSAMDTVRSSEELAHMVAETGETRGVLRVETRRDVADVVAQSGKESRSAGRSPKVMDGTKRDGKESRSAGRSSKVIDGRKPDGKE